MKSQLNTDSVDYYIIIIIIQHLIELKHTHRKTNAKKLKNCFFNSLWEVSPN